MPEVGDYFTSSIGQQPVVISRDNQGELHCLINACSHRDPR
ncbi:Rieske 2Fe-2S domain-containing protein [Streptomyces tauricus]